MLNFREQEEVRTTIKVLFQRRYYKTYSECQLPDIAKEISEMMVYPKLKSIKSVIKDAKEALDSESEYSSKRKKYTNEDQRKIKGGSYKEHLCTSLMEHGNSYAATTQMVNSLCQAPNGLPRLSITSVYNAIQCKNHIVTITTGIPQTDEVIYSTAKHATTGFVNSK